MAGRILVSTGSRTESGGDYEGTSIGRRRVRNPAWDRFTITFADGGTLRLFDKRRLGRVRLDPDTASLGPDAGEVGVAAFREIAGRGAAPIKARLLDQAKIAGIGNLLADEVLWQARIDPRRPARDLDKDQLTELHRQLRKAIRAAIEKGGVHTGTVIEHRGRGRHCPRCGAQMQRATVGGRTTWFCPQEQ